MSISIFLLWLVSIALVNATTHQSVQKDSVHFLPKSQGYLVNCGGNDTVQNGPGGLKYTPDGDGKYIAVGQTGFVNQSDISPVLSTVRYFPNAAATKYCYTFQVYKGGRFLVKTVYYYGGFDGGKEPPVFDQIIDGTKWSFVNTTDDYSQGFVSYYEIVVMAIGKTLSVCLSRNEHTVSSPFISAIEVHPVPDSLYNSTDFNSFALVTVARHDFGSAGNVLGFPDDKYNRYWQPLVDEDNPVTSCHTNVTPVVFWNDPPKKVFQTAMTTSRGKTLNLKWPPFGLPSSLYYIALYFQDSRSTSAYSWRVFDVDINGEKFYKDLNVTTSGVTVYSPKWPLNGQTEISLIPRYDMPVGPIISAAEVLQLLPLGHKTLTRDEAAMDDLVDSFDHNPEDWNGDPCLPKENAWTGVSCSEGKSVRVVSLNLTGFGLMGSLPPTIAKLTALKHLWLGDNKLTGPIPDLSQLKALETLHLENNQFEGPIPESLAQLPKLQELYLQNNNLNSDIPQSLANKTVLKLQGTPQRR